MTRSESVVILRSFPRNDILLPVGIGALLCGLLVAAQTIYLAFMLRSPLLQLDEWRVLPRYIEFVSGKLTLMSFLLEDHFGHRPALTRLLFILDAEFTGATQALTKTISIVLCGALLGLFAIVLLRQKQLPYGLKLLGIGLVSIALLPTQQIHNFSIGWNNTILTAVFFAVLALYAVTIAAGHAEGSNRERLGRLRASLRCLEHILHGQRALGLAHHARCLPAVSHVASRRNCGAFRRHCGSRISLELPKNRIAGRGDAAPGELLAYVVTFLGTFIFVPFLPPYASAALFGCIGILLVVYHFVRQGFRTGSDQLATWFLLGVSLFSIGTAELTALGRIRFGAEVGLAPVRSTASN